MADPVAEDVTTEEAGIIIVGAGLAGLAAGVEAARAGADVLIIDMNSVFGGHGIQSGGVAIIDSPLQEQLGYLDSPETAFSDWLQWTEEPQLDWMRYYVENSREEIWDFLVPLGVRFDRITPSHGNSVPRFHMTWRRGLNLVRPLFLEALRYPNLRFRWNIEALELMVESGIVEGVVLRDMRTGEHQRFAADAVILATGGFQRDPEMVKEHWPTEFPRPERVLTGSGKYSLGLGHRMAAAAGAALVDLNRQYNSYTGIPDPRDPRGRLAIGAGNEHAVWVNTNGDRFVNPLDYDKEVYRAVAAQPGGTYWAVFDQGSRETFRVRSADPADRAALTEEVLGNEALVKRADSLPELAEMMHVPPGRLADAVSEHNALVETGENDTFGPFAGSERTASPRPLQTPPYYAVRFYLTAHKNMGGIAIDLRGQALDTDGVPVPGLYAAGEVTGSAGINGKAGLDGTFTGPAILIGRVAGRSAAADTLAARGHAPGEAVMLDSELIAYEDRDVQGDNPRAAMDESALRSLLQRSRDGYWHFEQVHESVLRRGYACTQCHSEAMPMRRITYRQGWRAQAESCDNCHLGPDLP